MSTVDEIVRDIQAAAPINIGGLAIARWIDNRYKEMVSKIRFRHLRKLGELVIPGVIDDGTVTVTRGSTAVVGVGTTFETSISAGDQEHYYFRTASAWYKITSITDETNLVLASNFAEDDVSAGSYEIVKRTHSLASTARWLGEFVHTRRRRSLGEPVSPSEMDIQAPGRILSNLYPQLFSLVGVDSDGYLKVEIYPPPSESEIIHYVYWDLPTALVLSSTIPAQIDAYTLKEGALVDVYRFAKVKQIEMGNVEPAAVYANEEAKQRTTWEKALKDARRTQKGADDSVFVLSFFPQRGRTADITTATDHVLSNWSR